MISESAREQANIALELADTGSMTNLVGAVAHLAAAVRRLADIVDHQEQLLDQWARETATLKGQITQEVR